MARHTNDCGANHPRGCRPNCNCWCHDNSTEMNRKLNEKAKKECLKLGMNPKYL